VLAFLPWQIIMGMSMLRRERVGVAIAMSLGAMFVLSPYTHGTKLTDAHPVLA
jgi:hypothetical protein